MPKILLDGMHPDEFKPRKTRSKGSTPIPDPPQGKELPSYVCPPQWATVALNADACASCLAQIPAGDVCYIDDEFSQYHIHCGEEDVMDMD